MEESYKHFISSDGREISLSQGQIEAVDFLLHHKGCILSLQTGYGKSLTVCVASKILLDRYADSHVLIVCPVKAKKSFKRELLKNMNIPKEEVSIFSTEETRVHRDSRYTIVTSTNIEKISEEFFNTHKDKKIILVIDEAHSLQQKNSQFYKTMDSVKKKCILAWGITATPILNNLDSLFTIVNFFCPGYLGTKTSFYNNYVKYHLADQYIQGGRKIKIRVIDGYKNLDILQMKLKDVMIVRQKQYNLKFATIQKDLTDTEKEIYEQVSSGMLGESDDRNFSRRLHDLQRYLDNAYESDKTLKNLVKKFSKNTQQYHTKEKTLLQAVKATMGKGYATIIYADYKDTIHRLKFILEKERESLGVHRIFEITGSIDIKTREQVEEQIDNKDIILITSAGTESINLQRCNCIIFYDISFSVKTNIQTIGRICRMDTKYPYQYIITIVMKDTIDEYKYTLFQNHLNMIQQSVGTSQDLPLSEDYLMTDSRDSQYLKDTLLWKYKKRRKRKSSKPSKLVVNHFVKISPVRNYTKCFSQHFFLTEPVDLLDTMVIPLYPVMPDSKDYLDFKQKKIPPAVYRFRYKAKLETEEAKEVIKKLRILVKEEHTILLIGDTLSTEMLKDKI